jgi:hypothetical protein
MLGAESQTASSRPSPEGLRQAPEQVASAVNRVQGQIPRTLAAPETRDPETAGKKGTNSISWQPPKVQEWQSVPLRSKDRTSPGAPKDSGRPKTWQREEHAGCSLGAKGNRKQVRRGYAGHNQGLARKGFPSFIRVMDEVTQRQGTLSALLGTILVPNYRDLLAAAARQADQSVIQWNFPNNGTELRSTWPLQGDTFI